jgi:putative ABC transport system permease protein
MFKHYWTTALRNLMRSKLFTFINIIGLSVSIAIFLALSGYVTYQLSFDKFYKNGDQIYRIDYYEYQESDPVLQSARTHDRTLLLLHEYVPEVEAVTRVYHEKAYVFTEDVKIVDQNMLYTDSSFFKVFPVKLLRGSEETALIAPGSVVISESQARVYFGPENPMGKIIYFNENLPFTITGVFEDIPKNSSIDYDFLLSWSTLYFYGWIPREGSFNYPWTYTFVKLRNNVTDLNLVNKRLTDLANEHITTLEQRQHHAKQELRPYEKLHLGSTLSGELKPGTNLVLLYSLISLAIFILVAAWINYVNLSLARSLERANEIGVRKVFGASRTIISGQFLLEAVILALIAFLLGFAIFYFFTCAGSSLLFSGVTFAFPDWTTTVLYFLAFALGTMLAAFYPAHFISRYKPVLILNNKLGTGKGRASMLHQALMVFQLFLAIAIVGTTLIAIRQITFMKEADTGFNGAQTITVRAPASTNSDSLRLTRYRAFRNEVLQHPAFIAGASSMNIPGEEIRFHDESVHPVGTTNDKKQSFWVMWIDEGYQETFGMKLFAGRNFNAEEKTNACLINESAARALGYNNPAEAVNTNIVTQDNQALTIIGLWQDYHHETLRKPVEPVLFYYRHPHEYGYYSFKVQTTQGDYLQALEKIYSKHYPDDSFNYYFLDRFFAAQYQSDQLFTRLLSIFSVISILIACLGLFGMATLAMVKRTKEIGVRKVLGASVWNILLLLSKSYVRLILISCVFAFPISYYLTFRWLQGFAYQIEIKWWMIVLPGILVLAAMLLTISAQSIKKATANPARTLRDQ